MRSPQDDPAEELEPLFDYSRVQPQDSFRFADDDDSDCEDRKRKRKRKRKRMNGCDFEGVKGGKVFIDLDSDDGGDEVKLKDGDVEDDEDWLVPPPPKIPNTVSRLLDDKTLQELRLKKQELESVAQSAEKLLKEVSTKKEFNVSARFSMDAEVDKPQKHKVERQKVVISIQDKDGQRQFRLYKDDNFERLFKMYADKVKVSLDRLVFSFDGDKVGPSATPDSLGMEDDDMLEAHVK